MTATYRMPAREIPDDFLDILRQTFHSGEVSITVEEIPEHSAGCEAYSSLPGNCGSHSDETEYLLSSDANRRDLLEAVEAERRGEFYRIMTLDEAEAL